MIIVRINKEALGGGDAHRCGDNVSQGDDITVPFVSLRG